GGESVDGFPRKWRRVRERLPPPGAELPRVPDGPTPFSWEEGVERHHPAGWAPGPVSCDWSPAQRPAWPRGCRRAGRVPVPPYVGRSSPVRAPSCPLSPGEKTALVPDW